MENCLVLLWSPEEIGAEDYILRINKYENASNALDAFAETPCYYSILVDEKQARAYAELWEEDKDECIDAIMMNFEDPSLWYNDKDRYL